MRDDADKYVRDHGPEILLKHTVNRKSGNHRLTDAVCLDAPDANMIDAAQMEHTLL